MNNTAEVRTFESLKVGESASLLHQITEQDIGQFSRLSGDYNPLHSDDSYAREAGFASRVVHGMFIGALVSQIVGMRLPGKYALLMRESLEFKKPVFIGETLVIEGTIAAKSEATKIIELSIIVTRGGEIIVLGNVHVRVLK